MGWVREEVCDGVRGYVCKYVVMYHGWIYGGVCVM